MASRMLARLVKTVALSGTLIISSVAAAQAITIFDEDFSSSVPGQGYNGAITGTLLEVTSGNVDILGPLNGPPVFGCDGNPGGNCLDLIGSQGQAIVQSTTTFNLVAGTTYTVTWTDYLQGGHPANSDLEYTVALGSYSDSFFSNPVTTLMTLQFTAAANESAVRLVFDTVGNINNVHGPVISAILIDAVAPVPLPAALPLFASALAGLGFMKWRRRKTAV